MAVTARGWLALSVIGAVVTIPIALAVGGTDRSLNDPARPSSTADTVPNMYTRQPPAPPYGARWAPPTWGDRVAGDSHGWSLALVERRLNSDEDSVHVYTDTLTRLEPGVYRTWVRYRYRRLLVDGVVDFQPEDIDCVNERRRVLGAWAPSVSYDTMGRRLDSLPTQPIIMTPWRDVGPSEESRAIWHTVCSAALKM